MKQWPAMSADTCCFHEAAQLRAGPLPYSVGPNLRCGFPRESEVSGTEQSLPEQERNPQKGVGEVKAESLAPFTASRCGRWPKSEDCDVLRPRGRRCQRG